jgi:aryl-alcohol dehydrogenase-like predicted oxidoreductase
VYEHAGTARRLAVLGEVAGELGVTRNQVVLAWLLGGDPPISPIVGVSTAEQLDEALAARKLRLSDDQRRRLDEAARSRRARTAAWRDASLAGRARRCETRFRQE